MDQSYIRKMILADLQGKRVFVRQYNSCPCTACGEEINEGDHFYFFGNKQANNIETVCDPCYNSILEHVESISI